MGTQSFNPSVGILFIQASPQRARVRARTSFNPSVGILFIQATVQIVAVAIGTGFNPSVGILFIQAWRPRPPRDGSKVSIPRSGFCSFKRNTRRGLTDMCKGFNPSVGILFIQASPWHWVTTPTVPFQSLGRDSVHSSCEGCGAPLPSGAVSIPRSGFCSFKRGIIDRPAPPVPVSIPRSGFCSFKLML